MIVAKEVGDGLAAGAEDATGEDEASGDGKGVAPDCAHAEKTAARTNAAEDLPAVISRGYPPLGRT